MTVTDLTGTTAIVTGASRGFGRAAVIALVAHGAHVVGVARNRPSLEDLADKLGATFTPVVADVTKPKLSTELISDYHPRVLVLNAGATPPAAPLSQHTWDTFSRNWDTDVQHVFRFVREGLLQPLVSGSTVISLSSGAATGGSPLSGGYAGAKATIRFISAYAGMEAERRSLGIRFVSLLPQITPATDLGAPFVAAYAEYNGLTPEHYLSRLGIPVTLDQVGEAILEIAIDSGYSSPAYRLTANGLDPLD